ncbi:MAG: 2Fe-2S iron-sulfur cluster binding domain-containing protein [Gammaproteobacteria bacterium]|nr:2Fe-2S iron-sulfur cluster binding domain-containing protein [Gammaproteobacteria bacterium]
MTDTLQFFIDQQAVPFQPGQTLMQAAQAAGLYIPHLCFHDGLTPHGSCRVCIVEINGSIRAACTTPATANLQVHSETSALRTQRRQLIELLFAEGNHLCPSCEVSGNCQLQALAYDLGMTHYEFVPLDPHRQNDGSHPDLFIEQDRCIFCELCTRSAQQQDHKNVFGIGGRGADTYLFAQADSSRLADTAITAQDHAAHICPVGCILPKQGSYQIPIGQRVYDEQPIHLRGNHRPDEQDATP